MQKIKKTVKKATPKEQILGKKDVVELVDKVTYDSPEKLYKVTNYENDNREIIVTGFEIETFIGLDNDAREDLKAGEKEVFIYDRFEKDKAVYKIEVEN